MADPNLTPEELMQLYWEHARQEYAARVESGDAPEIPIGEVVGEGIIRIKLKSLDDFIALIPLDPFDPQQE